MGRLPSCQGLLVGWLGWLGLAVWLGWLAGRTSWLRWMAGWLGWLDWMGGWLVWLASVAGCITCLIGWLAGWLPGWFSYSVIGVDSSLCKRFMLQACVEVGGWK